jgi:hypothetical protein
MVPVSTVQQYDYVHFIDNDCTPSERDGFYERYRSYLDANQPLVAQPASAPKNLWKKTGGSAHTLVQPRSDCAARFTNFVEGGAIKGLQYFYSSVSFFFHQSEHFARCSISFISFRFFFTSLRSTALTVLFFFSSI